MDWHVKANVIARLAREFVAFNADDSRDALVTKAKLQFNVTAVDEGYDIFHQPYVSLAIPYGEHVTGVFVVTRGDKGQAHYPCVHQMRGGYIGVYEYELAGSGPVTPDRQFPEDNLLRFGS